MPNVTCRIPHPLAMRHYPADSTSVALSTYTELEIWKSMICSKLTISMVVAIVCAVNCRTGFRRTENVSQPEWIVSGINIKGNEIRELNGRRFVVAYNRTIATESETVRNDCNFGKFICSSTLAGSYNEPVAVYSGNCMSVSLPPSAICFNCALNDFIISLCVEKQLFIRAYSWIGGIFWENARNGGSCGHASKVGKCPQDNRAFSNRTEIWCTIGSWNHRPQRTPQNAQVLDVIC